MEGHGGDPWVKADAVADALSRADGDVLVVVDADVWVDRLDVAVTVLGDVGRWVIPHHLVHRLTDPASEAVLAGAEWADAAEMFGYAERPYPGWPGGGCVVVRREDYERAPLDRRFVGFGQEDISWSLALDTLVGPHVRLDAPLWHLWHPPQPRLNRRIGSHEGEALWQRYRTARRRAERMAALVAEGRA